MTITLIGFMGAGKTTVAQELSKQLKVPHHDLDQLIERAAGLTIPAYFDQFGEPAFRQLEQTILAQALEQDGVLSTGGGAPIPAKNQELLQGQDQPIIFLAANDQTIRDHLLTDGQSTRPLFQQLGLKGLLELKHQRQAIYEKIATKIITVDNKNSTAIAKEIIDHIQVSIEED